MAKHLYVAITMMNHDVLSFGELERFFFVIGCWFNFQVVSSLLIKLHILLRYPSPNGAPYCNTMSVGLSLCLFVCSLNYPKGSKSNELTFWGMIPQGIQMVLDISYVFVECTRIKNKVAGSSPGCWSFRMTLHFCVVAKQLVLINWSLAVLTPCMPVYNFDWQFDHATEIFCLSG